MSEWQDISTAPKDGINFLAITNKNQILFCQYQGERLIVIDSDMWEFKYEKDENLELRGQVIAHWMSLPKPPEKKHYCYSNDKTWFCKEWRHTRLENLDNPPYKFVIACAEYDSCYCGVNICPFCGAKA